MADIYVPSVTNVSKHLGFKNFTQFALFRRISVETGQFFALRKNLKKQTPNGAAVHHPLPLATIFPGLINPSPIAVGEARRGGGWRKITAIFY